MSAYIIAHNCHTQHRTVLIIFPLILQTIITAQMMYTGGERATLSYCGQQQTQSAVDDDSCKADQ